MYSLEVMPQVDKIFLKIKKKSPKLLVAVSKKVEQIRKNPYHSYKPLRKPLHGFCRVHVEKHFVLLFKLDHINKVLVIHHFAHHNDVYQWRP